MISLWFLLCLFFIIYALRFITACCDTQMLFFTIFQFNFCFHLCTCLFPHFFIRVFLSIYYDGMFSIFTRIIHFAPFNPSACLPLCNCHGLMDTKATSVLFGFSFHAHFCFIFPGVMGSVCSTTLFAFKHFSPMFNSFFFFSPTNIFSRVVVKLCL